MKQSFIKNGLKKWNKLLKKDTNNKVEEKREKEISLAKDETSVSMELTKTSENYHEVIGRMSAFFAHEIRNPLTSIIGFSQYLEKDATIKSDPSVAQYISIIKEEATKMELLIQELLSLSNSHLHHDNLSIIDVKQSVDKVVNIFSMQETNNRITFHTDAVDDAYITGNTSRFERVLINLFKNAIEAIEEEGTIDIRVRKEGKSVILDIIDSGPGISPEHLEQIFFPFYTTKDEGTGIGLPICKTIIETLNGNMSIQNSLTKGVHVKIQIPQCKHVFNRN